MNEQERRDLIENYLGELARELKDVPGGARSELLEDLRGHIEEAWASSPDQSRVGLMNILERLGEPHALAREERERLGLADAPIERGPGLLEVAAIVLTAIFWPVGILLAWLSPRWGTRDKAIATAIPLLGLVLLLVLSFASYVSFTSGPVVTQEVAVAVDSVPGQSGDTKTSRVPAASLPSQSAPSMAALPIATLLALYGFLGAPLTSALYLAVRLRPRVRRRVVLALAFAPLVLFALLVFFFTPVASQPGVQPAHSVTVQDSTSRAP